MLKNPTKKSKHKKGGHIQDLLPPTSIVVVGVVVALFYVNVMPAQNANSKIAIPIHNTTITVQS